VVALVLLVRNGQQAGIRLADVIVDVGDAGAVDGKLWIDGSVSRKGTNK